MSVALHRLFLAFPVPAEAAETLAEWSSIALNGLPVRTVPAHQLHVTLLFFAGVTDDQRDAMAGLVRSAPTQVMRVGTEGLHLLGRTALSIDLSTDPAALAGLEERVFRQPPLAELWRFLDPAERQRFQRRGGLRLHVTLGRVKAPVKVTAKPPPLSFELGSLVLYESKLSSLGATYTPLAESLPNEANTMGT